jgi:hypothetical protein
MNKNILLIFLLLTASTILYSCSGGLEPIGEKGKSYLTGTITYINGKDGWMPADSVIAVRVAAFKQFPSENIIAEVLIGNAVFTDTLPRFVDNAVFSLEIEEPPVNLSYIVVVLQYDEIITSQMPIGVYTLTGDKTKPDSLDIEIGKTYNIEIEVDFNNLPPMPF